MRTAQLVGVMILLAGASCAPLEQNAAPEALTGPDVIVDPPGTPNDATVRLLDGATTVQCTGTLISATHVLTAAHCMRDFAANAITMVGARPVRAADISGCLVHPAVINPRSARSIAVQT